MKIALIKDNTVQNVIQADSLDFAQALLGYDSAVDITGQEIGPGFSYDGTTFSAPQESPVVKSWDELELKRALTQSERLAIRQARLSDAVIEDFMDLIEATVRSGGRLKADDSDFIAGLDYLVQQELLSTERKAEILSDET